jgi:hypothetical protein
MPPAAAQQQGFIRALAFAAASSISTSTMLANSMTVARSGECWVDEFDRTIQTPQ